MARDPAKTRARHLYRLRAVARWVLNHEHWLLDLPAEARRSADRAGRRAGYAKLLRLVALLPARRLPSPPPTFSALVDAEADRMKLPRGAYDQAGPVARAMLVALIMDRRKWLEDGKASEALPFRPGRL